MALQIGAILSGLATLATAAQSASAAFGGMRETTVVVQNEERFTALEGEIKRVAGLAAGLATQTRAVAEELLVLERRLKTVLWLAIAGTALGATAVVVAIVR